MNYKKVFSYSLFLALISGYVWFVYSALHPRIPKPSDPPLLYSNQCRQDLKITLLEAIGQAKKSIHLVSFGLTDRAILRALEKKSRSGIRTTIFYDTRASTPHIRSNLRNTNLYPIRSKGFMHQKILVIDDEIVFLGSANMTSSSLKMHDNLIIGIFSPKLAHFLVNKSPLKTGQLKCTVAGQLIEVWLLPDARAKAVARIRNLLRHAKKKLRIAMFSLTHQTLLDEVVDAYRRGVDVKIVVDFHTGIGANSKALERLRKAHVPIILSQGIQLMHHKFIYIDDSLLLCGSANWTKAAFYKNHDCFVILYNLREEQKKYIHTIWNALENEGP